MPKQKDGRYRKKITIPGVGVKYASGTTRRELEENARRIREKFIDGIDPRSVTFQELILEWFNVIKRPRIKTAATLRNYQNAINVHIMPFFPEMQLLRAVRRADLQACLDACTGMNETTIRLVRAVLIHAMEYAVAEGMLRIHGLTGHAGGDQRHNAARRVGQVVGRVRQNGHRAAEKPDQKFAGRQKQVDQNAHAGAQRAIGGADFSVFRIFIILHKTADQPCRHFSFLHCAPKDAELFSL